MKRPLVLIALALAAIMMSVAMSTAAEQKPAGEARKTELATFGGGCFWCMEAVFERLDGVSAVTSGYAGGDKTDPPYQEGCFRATGHAEGIQVPYDAKKNFYPHFIHVFWGGHRPTSGK